MTGKILRWVRRYGLIVAGTVAFICALGASKRDPGLGLQWLTLAVICWMWSDQSKL